MTGFSSTLRFIEQRIASGGSIHTISDDMPTNPTDQKAAARMTEKELKKLRKGEDRGMYDEQDFFGKLPVPLTIIPRPR